MYVLTKFYTVHFISFIRAFVCTYYRYVFYTLLYYNCCISVAMHWQNSVNIFGGGDYNTKKHHVFHENNSIIKKT